MKKFTLLLSLLFAIVSIQAQDYQISFAGTGASNTVETVTVENLTQGKSVTLSGTEVLHLAKTITGLDPILDQDKALHIYPNPTTDNSTLEFVATASCKANIEIFDISGKRVVTNQVLLQIGTNSFQISGLGSGIFTVRIASQAYTYTGKMVSNGTPNSKVKISYIGSSSLPVTAKKLKSASAEKAMQYNIGDRLKITGKSGIYSTVIVDVPTQSKAIPFKFVACTDVDGNNYPIVEIGTQVWMAENLNTTKYNDGSPIPNETDNIQWSYASVKYCNYNNMPNTSSVGKLYNCYAVKNAGDIAPTGWHVPTYDEWTTLETYVKANLGTSGSVAKALASTTHWNSSTIAGDPGNDLRKNNTSGFTALPTGYRDAGGVFKGIGSIGYWWSSTGYGTDAAWSWYILYDLKHNYYDRRLGLSVRCVKDNNTVIIVVPTVTTNPITNITQNAATCGGKITSDGGATVTERGVCYNTSINPTTTNSKFVIGTGAGSFSNTITGLTANATYYVRAYAINSQGTAYGDEVNFKTSVVLPLASLTTSTPTNITSTSATLGGNISSDGNVTVTERGICYSKSANPTTSSTKVLIGNGVGSFSNSITGLTANTTYYVRAYANNSQVTTYGNEVNFKTSLALSLAILTTISPASITTSSATLGGNITSDGNATITERGVCYSTSAKPTTSNTKVLIGNGVGSFSNSITGLTANVTYYVRAYAINSQGTAYSNEITFKTYYGQVIDLDGNIYHTVYIGTQLWMVENLKTTKYRDGSPIPNVTDNTSWGNLTTGAYCNYNNDVAIGAKYGKLYNWYAVSNSRNIAPTGWHVPSDYGEMFDSEWSTLETYVAANLGPLGTEAKALASTTDWNSSTNDGAVGRYLIYNNATGFTALPGGGRYSDGSYEYNGSSGYVGGIGYWWSSTESNSIYARSSFLAYSNAQLGRQGNIKSCGFSVRCVKDKNTSETYLPTIITTTVSAISTTTATSGGNITNYGGAGIIARGVCWSTSSNPTIANSKSTDGTGAGSFTSSMTNLIAGTLYYVRSYATNSVGTAYGNQINFTITGTGTVQPVIDNDGNVYHTVTIGTQVWMVENLKTTRYRDGTDIPNVTDNTSWAGLTTGAFCWNNNDISYKNLYGAKYNWYTINTGKLAPTGWHVPTDAEWITLKNYVSANLGTSGSLAKALASKTDWATSTVAGAVGNDLTKNNTTGFTALPGSYRNYDGTYYPVGSSGNWWSSTEYETYRASSLYIYDVFATTFNGLKNDGFSVRCLKD